MHASLKKAVSVCRRAVPFLLLFFIFTPADLYARAGGGGGGGGKGGIFTIILYPFLLAYIAYLHHKISVKNKAAEALIEKFSEPDSAWKIEGLKSRIEVCFFKVQEAWMERNQDLARECLSRRLYEKHKAQTDLMVRNQEKNILKDINLIEANIVEAIDYRDNSKDHIWVYISGSMIDYTIKEPDNSVIKGDANKNEKFSELWKFVREDGGWVLDEIDQEVSLDDISSFRSYGE
jgi:hypothetical protein